MEGRLEAKIEGAKDTLEKKIAGTKDELTASIDGVKSEVVTIKWIIGIAAGLFVAFLGFVGHLLNHYVKKVLPNTIQRWMAQKQLAQAVIMSNVYCILVLSLFYPIYVELTRSRDFILKA